MFLFILYVCAQCVWWGCGDMPQQLCVEVRGQAIGTCLSFHHVVLGQADPQAWWPAPGSLSHLSAQSLSLLAFTCDETMK